MREIKLKVWDSKNKLMLIPDESVDNNLSVPACDYDYDYAEYLEYTGLNDINGVEIYEGDVVEVLYNGLGKVIVSFKEGKFNISGYSVKNCRVVGNIYENPKLLEVK